MPTASSPVAAVLEIAPVMLAGNVYIQLMDGRMFATIGGKALNTNKASYIVPATDEHWEALHVKTVQIA